MRNLLFVLVGVALLFALLPRSPGPAHELTINGVKPGMTRAEVSQIFGHGTRPMALPGNWETCGSTLRSGDQNLTWILYSSSDRVEMVKGYNLSDHGQIIQTKYSEGYRLNELLGPFSHEDVPNAKGDAMSFFEPEHLAVRKRPNDPWLFILGVDGPNQRIP